MNLLLNMKLLDKVKEIVDAHPFTPIELDEGYKNIYQHLRENDTQSSRYYIENTDSRFIEKYRQYIPNGWYGFDIGSVIIPEWYNIIDKTLELCIKNDPSFEIHQIKMKFGGIRFYVISYAIEDISDIEDLLENTLFDEALIY